VPDEPETIRKQATAEK